MFKYFKPYLKTGVVAAGFKMGESFADLSLPLIMARIIDTGVKNRNFEYILLEGRKMLIIVIAGYLCAIISNYFSSKTSQEFGANLREKIFIKIQTLSFKQLNKFSHATLITRITKDVDQLTNMFLMSIRMVLRGLVTGIGAVIMAVIINPVLSIILLIVVPLIIAFTVFAVKKTFTLYDLVQKKLDKLILALRENLIGIKVVKALSKEKIEEKKFNRESDELEAQVIEAESLILGKLPFISLIMNLGIVGVLWFGGIRVHYGKVEVGEIVAFINYLNMILFAMNALSFLFTLYSKTSASYKRIDEIMEIDGVEKKEQYEKEKVFSGNIIEFNEVSFTYCEGEKNILENINLKIKQGERIGIIGSIGSGKTSLISLIARFYDVKSGEVRVDDIDVRNYTEEVLRKKIGIVLQKVFLFSDTIKENLKWGDQNATDEEIKEVCRVAQASEFIEKLETGYDTLVQKGGNNFSGGQKQRLSIARTLLKKPKILIFDDSFSALDFITENNLEKELYEYLKNVTTITISHKVYSLVKMDRIIVMDEGRVVGFDTHINLLKTCSVYKEICESQEIKMIVG